MYEFQKKKLRQLLGKHYDTLKKAKCILAGGAVRSIFCNNEVNDFDIYFKTPESFIDVAVELEKAICHTDKATLYKVNGILIQLIHFKLFDSVEDVFKVFDFTCCMGAYDFEKEEFVLAEGFLEDNACKQLTFNDATKFPIVSALRVDKYREKGYSISKSEYIRVLLTCMKLNINSWKELKHHMGGMYGINIDKLFKDDEPFSLDSAIKQLENLYLREDYNEYMLKDEFTYFDVEDVIKDIPFIAKAFDVFELRGDWWYIGLNGKLELTTNADMFNKVSLEVFFNKHRLYKNICKHEDGKYTSFYDSDFEYHLDKEVEAEEHHNEGWGLYFCYDKDCPHRHNDRSVLVVAEPPKAEDIIDVGSQAIRLKRATVHLVKKDED